MWCGALLPRGRRTLPDEAMECRDPVGGAGGVSGRRGVAVEGDVHHARGEGRGRGGGRLMSLEYGWLILIMQIISAIFREQEAPSGGIWSGQDGIKVTHLLSVVPFVDVTFHIFIRFEPTLLFSCLFKSQK